MNRFDGLFECDESMPNVIVEESLEDIEAREELIEEMLHNREISKKAKVGSQIACGGCSALITKTSYQHGFCGTQCKDYFHNLTNDKRRARAAFYGR